MKQQHWQRDAEHEFIQFRRKNIINDIKHMKNEAQYHHKEYGHRRVQTENKITQFISPSFITATILTHSVGETMINM